MRAKKSLGQNFLHNEAVIGAIVKSLGLTPEDLVLEVGPGRGALTDQLLQTNANVLAIEIDRNLVPALRVQFHFQENFEVIEADILEADLNSILSSRTADKVKFVGNLPYYISTAILQKLILDRHLFSRVVVMLQREVADRITAVAGSSDRGFLTVLVESAFSVERVIDVPPTAFEPRPKVWSSVVSMTPKPTNPGDTDGFRALVSAAFEQKRKTIFNNLKRKFSDAAASLGDAGIDPLCRAETLTNDEWIGLAASITNEKRP